MLLHCSVPVLLQDGYTALLHAAIGGHQEVVSLLLERGADAGAKGEVE
jgi:ankyrin repeat protein